MLTREQNDLLTQTGPGHADGRSVPPLLDSRAAGGGAARPDCPPVRVKLLGERLLAFRDSAGRLGLIDEFCAHRGVSLWFGRNEESGLRCPYHGWKYDVTGQCVDVPSEPRESGFCNASGSRPIRAIERGGVVWAYMGPPAHEPPLPALEWATVPADAALRVQAAAGMQLPAGDGRRHRFVARLVPAQATTSTTIRWLGNNEERPNTCADAQPAFEVVPVRQAAC